MLAWQFRTTFERIRCGIARRIGLEVDLLNSAVSIDELHPAETICGPPCVALSGQYERVRACPFGIDMDKEIAELRGAPRFIGPTVRYVIENVLINHSTVYAQGKRKTFNNEVRLNQAKFPWIDHDEVVIRSSVVGCHFFGHWLRDDCATHLLAEQAGTPMSLPTPPWPDRADYLSLFGQSYAELGRSHVRRLMLFDDISQNTHKVGRWRALRARIEKNRQSGNASRIVYLMRGAGGKERALLNEPEIVEALTRQGVVVLRAELLSVLQLFTELAGARIVISIEGSQLSHALYALREGAGLLVIQPPYRFFNSHMDWARPLNVRYGFVVAEQREACFYLPIDDLLRTIDLMDADLR